MEILPKSAYFKFKPNQVQAVRKMYNMEKPGRMEEALDLLSAWVKKQEHFRKKDFSRGYLERVLVATKGSVEKAKMQMDKLCTFKTIWPELFTATDINAFEKYSNTFIFLLLPDTTDDYGRVSILKVFPNQSLPPEVVVEFIKYSIIVIEYMKIISYSSGFEIILDLKDFNLLEILKLLTPTQLNQIFTLTIKGYGMRVKGIHFVTNSKLADTFVSLFKQVLSKKLSDRIHVHQSYDTIHEFIPKKILPVDYGGEVRCLNKLRDDLQQELGTKKYMEHMREMNAASTDESKRLKTVFNDLYVNMPGTFRSLSVD